MGSSTADERWHDLEEAASQAKLGFWEYAPRDSTFRGSSSVRKILGLAQETVPLETVSGLFGTEASETLVRGIELSLRVGKPFKLVSEISTPSGRRMWIRVHGQSRGRDSAEPPSVFGTIQDISDIRLLDVITQESEMTLNQVEQITHIGHWSVSLSDGSLYHSDEIKRIFGYEPSEYALSVEQAIEAYHPDDREEVVRLFNRAVETGEGYEFDLRIIQPSGDVRHVHSKGYTEQDETGSVRRVYGVFQDITERVLAEHALRESEASMKTLIDAVHTAIVVHGKEGEILLSNQMANRLLAPLASEVVGKEITDPAWHFTFEDGTRIPVDELPVSRILRTQCPVENLVVGYGNEEAAAWLLVNGSPVFDNNGALSKIIISFVDITDHRRMEERLRQSQKMEAIGQLAGGVAHDFNNQLMVIMNFAGLLQRSLDRSSPHRSYTEGILSAVSRSAELIKQLLAFAREGKYLVTKVDLNELISEVVSMASHSFDKKIRITHNVSAQPATIAGDATQLQNALLNLALNSRDAMPGGGRLAFTTDRLSIAPDSLKDSALGIDPGECVRVTVSDNGCGMDGRTRERIFEPFFTTKAPGKGTGMGMASVYGTVTGHHGAIEIMSEPGAGTTIRMYFPLLLAGGEVRTDVVPKSHPTAGRILIVDDEKGVAESMGVLLDLEGFQTTICRDGREALSEFRSAWRNTDLVILDMIMPEMNGVELFREMKQIDPDVKAVLLSGHSFNDEAREIVEQGAAGFLLKPVNADKLLQTIANVLSAEAIDDDAPSR